MSAPFYDTEWYALERRLLAVTERIAAFGFPMDVSRAQTLLAELSDAEAEMAEALQRMLPPVDAPEIIVPKRNNRVKHYVKGEPFTKHKLVPFNPASSQQFVDRMTARHGSWPSTVMTDSGNPSCTAAVLATLPFPEAETLLHLKIATKRITMLTGPNGYLTKMGDDRRLHTSYLTLGAVTGRCSHRPNIAQCPAVLRDARGEPLFGAAGHWGYEFRAVFIPPPGMVLVGCDLVGIEARMLAHEMAAYDGGNYMRLVTGGTDLHELNRQNIGASTRAQSKRLLYACVPMDTQALTRRGWRGYEDVQVGELVLTYNAETRQKEWQPVLEKVYYPEADVMELRNDQTFSVRCTPNHRWFTTRRTWRGRHAKFQQPVADWLPEVVEAADLTSEHNIIVNAPMAPDGGELLTRWQDGPKYGPEWVQRVLDMSSAERDAWLCGFCLADGHWMQTRDPSPRRRGQWMWSQNEGDIAEAAILASFLAWDGRLTLTPRNTCPNPMVVGRQVLRNYVTCQQLQRIAHPRQPVWCIRTANQSWVMRQGSTITITGNTIYGCGNRKAGTIIQPDEDDDLALEIVGRQAKEALIAGIDGFRELFDWLESRNDDTLPGLDGRVLYARKKHARLNTLLQAGGAIVAKRWVVLVEAALQAAGLRWAIDYAILAFVHDELVVACRPALAEQVAKITEAAAIAAGEYYALRCPLAAQAKIGASWGAVH